LIAQLGNRRLNPLPGFGVDSLEPIDHA
jgi:hypothetical protein